MIFIYSWSLKKNKWYIKFFILKMSGLMMIEAYINSTFRYIKLVNHIFFSIKGGNVYKLLKLIPCMYYILNNMLKSYCWSQ